METKKDPKEIGKKLRELRGDRSQQTVADAVGVSQSALAMYELGERVPRDEVKTRLCRFYGCDVSIFFER